VNVTIAKVRIITSHVPDEVRLRSGVGAKIAAPENTEINKMPSHHQIALCYWPSKLWVQ